MKTTVALALILVSLASYAETPQQILKSYAPTANAARGGLLFHQKNTVNEKMAACSSCHTENLEDHKSRLLRYRQPFACLAK